jgi:hypothetical protein
MNKSPPDTGVDLVRGNARGYVTGMYGRVRFGFLVSAMAFARQAGGPGCAGVTRLPRLRATSHGDSAKDLKSSEIQNSGALTCGVKSPDFPVL